MAAPKGNQFWKLGNQTGRPRKFKTPADLWKTACEYFEWCDTHPLETIEYNGKDAIQCIVPKMRAYTWSGIECYTGVSNFEDYRKKYKEFSEIVTRIEKIIYTQKFEGAAAGLLNANIIARDLGLSEKKDITSDGEKLGFISPDTIAKIANKINGNSK